MFKNLNTRKELEKFYLKNNEGRVLWVPCIKN
jgi:hypothetical protein